MDKKCIQCSRIVEGRIDKKFCSDTCRSDYNNLLKNEFSNSTRKINNYLRNNRNILKELKHGAKVNKIDLQEKGFNFKYFTHIFTTTKSETYYYCYDYGYKIIANDICFLVKQKWHFIFNTE